MKGRVLIVAGSDSGGGAGIQADLKTVTALGAYGATALTAVTVQDTMAVRKVHQLPPDLVDAQARAVLKDIGADAIKIGMIGSADVARVIAALLEDYPAIPVILDPVLVATSGDALGDDNVAATLRDELLPLTTILTPNVAEAAAISGRRVETMADLEAASCDLLDLGTRGVMAKAGHLTDDPVVDFYLGGAGRTDYTHPRIETRHTHGTGCSLAAAIAAGIAQGLPAPAACERAVAYVAAAIAHAPGYGSGHGPLNHALRQTPQGFLPTAPMLGR